MQIDTRFIGNHSVLALHGNLVFGNDLIEFRSAVREAAEKYPKNITLNLANVNYIDSCGIGELVGAFNYTRNRGACLALTNLPKKVKILLDLARLTEILGVSNGERTPNTSSGHQMSLCPTYCPEQQGSTDL